ncbi:MAG TPA: single-stranded-DNA-specific exonuclease RecJ [Candidatus Dormibacteraeota bacterium]|nr:single-stranded-DNA-specific exonuclease RecJ [Candidatus Dormibacteraeota bacterium]
MVVPRYRWIPPEGVHPSPALAAAASASGFGGAALELLVARGVHTPEELAGFLAEPAGALHDPRLLPDADLLLARIGLARVRRERVMVFGDFDADGLTGLAILVSTLRALGLDVVPYVPSRLDEGHGLSMAAVDQAERDGVSLIVTVDTGSTSQREIGLAAGRGVEVAVTDHHRVPPEPPPAVAFVNPHRPDSAYPDARLAGSGVAFKVAQLLLAPGSGGPPDGDETALAMADLATIGTVSDLAPIVGENRAIARLGLERLRTAPRPGLAALLERANVKPADVDLERVAFALAPRLNAAGRVGEAVEAARLLLADDPAEATILAEALDTANVTRRDLTRQAVLDAREARAGTDDEAIVLARGPWPVGIVGLVAARLSEETGRPAVVGAEIGSVVRASCRSAPGFDLAAALESCSHLLLRHGGHAGAAGFEVAAERWDEVAAHLRALATVALPPDPRPSLRIDVALPAAAVDYALVRDVARLAPFGPGNPDPLVAVLDIGVGRARPANGGHTQLVLRRERDVLDAIAFGREDLVEALTEGTRVDVVARLASRSFAGIESLQLEVRDVGPAGTYAEAVRLAGAPAAAPTAEALVVPAIAAR